GTLTSTTYHFQLLCLIVVVERDATFLVGITAFLQRGIIQAAGFAQLSLKGSSLCGGGIETVRVGLAHLRPLLLVLDVTAHGCFRHVADRSDVVAATPQGRQLRAQMPKLLPQDSGRVALKLGSQLRRSHPRITLDKQMHVVRHHFQRMQRRLEFLSFYSQQGFEALCHRADQHRLAILGAKNEAIFERKYCVSITCIPVMFHTQSIVRCLMSINNLTRRKKRVDAWGILVPAAQRRFLRDCVGGGRSAPFLCHLKKAVPSPVSYGREGETR